MKTILGVDEKAKRHLKLKVHPDSQANVAARTVRVIANQAGILSIGGVQKVVRIQAHTHWISSTHYRLDSRSKERVPRRRRSKIQLGIDTGLGANKVHIKLDFQLLNRTQGWGPSD